MNPSLVGIMQGRLTAAQGGGQAFPLDWHDEFDAAAAAGFDAIEWLITDAGLADNPIWTASGRSETQRLAERSGVTVRSICADCFVTRRLADRPRQRAHVELLIEMIGAAAAANIPVIVIPLLEHSAVALSEVPQLGAVLRPAVEAAASRGVVLAIEADAETAVAVCHAAGSGPSLGVCYDTGNAAAIAADVTRDLATIGPALAAVHIKDRLHGGASVPLGQGSADFDAVFAALARLPVMPPLICETPRGSHPLISARQHAEFVRRHLAAAAALATP